MLENDFKVWLPEDPDRDYIKPILTYATIEISSAAHSVVTNSSM